jgi:hypothetical protein
MYMNILERPDDIPSFDIPRSTLIPVQLGMSGSRVMLLIRDIVASRKRLHSSWKK